MTNYHIIDDDFLKDNKELKISINNEKIIDFININENSKIYSSIIDEFDIMIIKLEEKKNIYHYLELDEHLFDENIEKIYKDQSIYILHYPMKKVQVSFGYGVKKADKCEYYINHFCNTENCSSGSPILNLETNKVIGIHSGFINKEPKYNIGILLKYPLNELNNIKNKEIKERKVSKHIKEIKEEKEIKEIIKKDENLSKKNEIKLEIKINKDDINKDIYFLDNTNDTYNNIKHYHDNLKELNESNTELYINDKKYKYKKYFNQDKEGIYYKIKIKY